MCQIHFIGSNWYLPSTLFEDVVALAADSQNLTIKKFDSTHSPYAKQFGQKIDLQNAQTYTEGNQSATPSQNSNGNQSQSNAEMLEQF